MIIVLWVIEGLLALAFLSAGIMKTFMPLATLQKNMAWTNHVPAPLVRFIGIVEILGAIGLILPVVTHIAPWLTIAAAVGLAIVMLLAALFHARRKEMSNIAPSIVLLLLSAFVVVSWLTFAHPYM